MGQQSTQFEDTVIIVGVGLIGGSIAAAVRRRFPDCKVVGIGRSEARLKAASAAGLLTDWASECTPELLAESAIVIVCLPVHLIAQQVHAIAAVSSDDVLITDAGSVKATICSGVQTCDRAAQLFIGSHPIAGGEQGGFEHAEADLFEDRVCVICASDLDANEKDENEKLKVDRVKRFWNQLGCRVLPMSAEEHDRMLALTSHLPHVMAAATTAAVGAKNFGLTGSGFRDTTRIAAGNASLWKSILAANREQVILAIQVAEKVLCEYRTALECEDDDRVELLLRDAASSRSELDS